MSTAIVFDPKLWGGRDVGDNSQFWKEAEILHIYRTRYGEEVADVRFLHDGRISRGHFMYAIRRMCHESDGD